MLERLHLTRRSLVRALLLAGGIAGLAGCMLGSDLESPKYQRDQSAWSAWRISEKRDFLGAENMLLTT